MLMSHDFIRAEDKYRREVMRDQPLDRGRRGNHVFAKTAAAVVVAALLLTACGVDTKTDAGAVVPSRTFQDQAPTWQPDLDLLDRILNREVRSTQVVVPAIEFGGIAAPGWPPNYGRLETFLGANPTTGPR